MFLFICWRATPPSVKARKPWKSDDRAMPLIVVHNYIRLHQGLLFSAESISRRSSLRGTVHRLVVKVPRVAHWVVPEIGRWVPPAAVPPKAQHERMLALVLGFRNFKCTVQWLRLHSISLWHRYGWWRHWWWRMQQMREFVGSSPINGVQMVSRWWRRWEREFVEGWQQKMRKYDAEFPSFMQNLGDSNLIFPGLFLPQTAIGSF